MFKTPITDLDYELDASSIAQNRYKNPEYSNLLIAESKQILTFSEYIDGLKDKSVFVFNKSTVQNVRINTNKVLTNGKIEFFILNIHDNYHADCLIKTRSKINVGDELNTKIGLVTPDFLRKYRKYALVIVLILSAVITPPDIASQVIVAIPILILYQVSIYISKIVIRNQKRKENV